MRNKVQKGAYHVKRTVDWLEANGWRAEKTESKTAFQYPDKERSKPGKVVYKTGYKTKDIWGADVIASKDEILFVLQVKANAGDVRKGLLELASGGWPSNPFIVLAVVHWPLRRRTKEGPDLYYVDRREAVDGD